METQLYQILHGLVTKAISETINRDLTPLISRIGSQSKRLLTYTEAMTHLHISKPVFYRLLRQNRLRRVQIDKKTFRIDQEDLMQFIESQKV